MFDGWKYIEASWIPASVQVQTAFIDVHSELIRISLLFIEVDLVVVVGVIELISKESRRIINNWTRKVKDAGSSCRFINLKLRQQQN